MVLAASAGGQAGAQTETAGALDCILFAVGSAFRDANGGEYTVEASSTGRNCPQAALLIVIRDPEGFVAFSDSFAADQMFGFDMATQPDEMAAALEFWIEQPGESPSSTAELPSWTDATADGPGAADAEFPFFPEEWIDAETWEAIRAAALPLFCYAQGFESVRCVTLDPSGPRIEPLGVQTFPG